MWSPGTCDSIEREAACLSAACCECESAAFKLTKQCLWSLVGACINAESCRLKSDVALHVRMGFNPWNQDYLPMLLTILAACRLLLCTAVYHACMKGNSSQHFSYAFNGLDWPKEFPACSGNSQSPVLLPAYNAGPSKEDRTLAKATFAYGTLDRPTVVNNGASNARMPISGSSIACLPVGN